MERRGPKPAPAEATQAENKRGMPLRAEYPNHVWTYYFLADATAEGRKLRSRTVVDEFTQESREIKVDRQMPARAVITVLEGAFGQYGMPHLGNGNGSEFMARAVRSWLDQRGVQTQFIDPSSPWQNACGESFNSRFRDGFLNLEVFHGLAQTGCSPNSGAVTTTRSAPTAAWGT